MDRRIARQAHAWRRIAAVRRPVAALAMALVATLLIGCGGQSSSAFNRAAPVPADTLVAYTTAGRGDSASGDGVTGLRGRDGTAVWHTEIGRRTNAPMVVVGDVVYGEGETLSPPSAPGQPPSDAVVAVRLRDGRLLWRQQVPAAELTLTADGTSVLVAAGPAGLYALNSADGSIRWHQAGNVKGPVRADGGVVLAGVLDVSRAPDGPPVVHADSGLWGFRERDGAVLWKGAPGASAGSNQLAFYGNYQFNLAFARSLQDGRELWEYESARKLNGLGVRSEVIGVSAQLVLLETDGGVLALDARTGQVRWHSPQVLDGSAESGGPIVASDSASQARIFGSRRGEVFALRGSDGREIWHTTLPDYQSGTVTGMLDAQGVLFVMVEAPYCSPSLFGCAGPIYNRLVALDAATGAIFWWRDVPEGLLLAVAAPAA